MLTGLLKELGVVIEEYVIAQEEHKDGNIHFHAYIKLDKPSNKRGADILDIG